MEKGQTQGGLFTVQQQDGQCPAEEVISCPFIKEKGDLLYLSINTK